MLIGLTSLMHIRIAKAQIRLRIRLCCSCTELSDIGEYTDIFSKCPYQNTRFLQADLYRHCLYMPRRHTYFKRSSFAGLGGSVGCASDWRPGGRGFKPRRGQQHSFVEIEHEIFSTVILPLPLIQEGQLSVSGERMCTILVNRLED